MSREYKVSVPEGEIGDWKIKKFTVDNKKDKISQLSSLYSSGRFVPSGTYTKLTYKNDIVMSDTPDEIRDHLYFIGKAKGNILIAGLGLGMVIQAIGNKEDVKSITVIEKSKDVIDLVGDYYLKMFPNKLKIVNADIFEWKTSDYFDCAWYDIWNDLCTDNVEEMKKLHRKFGRRTGWQGSWGRDFLEYQRQKEKRYYY